MIEAISFDLDDTLWDNAPVIKAAESALADWVAQRVPELLPHYRLETLLQFRHDILAHRPQLRHRISELRELILYRALRHSGYPEEESRVLAAEGFALFLEARHRVTPFEESEPLLEQLAGRYRLIALTNGNADIHRLPLGRYFDHSVRAEQIDLAKPDPEFYRVALQRLGTLPERTLHIGDDLDNDVRAARQAGLFTLWFNPDAEPAPATPETEAHIEVNRLQQIPAAVEDWLAQRER
ncbi:HAD family hydrolase [Aestuariirhabdus litorea]|uniref:HAD family hydrolase n=1 Tax=Aestuariirhabdus litorea TaxID=2528527 RepID=A0A3P3VJR8_9GAMM|nr:HAD-IA family hydrolase [Aestuariirhabdus litorea]RRJ82952.1 HAD family hydrolase [Aestuariirhabdus litorea]RWW93111.1 HAD family hydrolase [Endozoicomonadaceae bacterium GTF-13]